MALRIYSKTRKKELVEQQANEGLCVHYNRVKSITRSISNQLCDQYEADGIVCPPKLQKGLFTTSAIDNIDHNSSSNTAKTSFHGTSISVFQHADTPLEHQPFTISHPPGSKCPQRKNLPDSYINIKPTKGGKPEPAKLKDSPKNFPMGGGVLSEASEWIRKLQTEEGSLEDRVTFSGFYSKQLSSKCNYSISQLLPLIPDSVNSPATVRHCTTIIKAITEKLNPGQIPVITADQPVYALGKQVQWTYPDEIGNVMWMMGPLHIEMLFLNIIGDWLNGSGWIEVYEKSTVSTAGKIESFLSGKHVKRSRYAHQVTLATLLHLAWKAYMDSSATTYAKWKEELSTSSPNAYYWLTTIDLQTKLFMFVRSIREANFDLFVRCLEELLPWVFALDHTNYARWLPVFIEDLKRLPLQKELFIEFCKGHFCINKTGRLFSAIGEDHAHEQNNKIIKTDGGAIGILDNKDALLEWATCGPQIAQMLFDVYGAEEDDSEEEYCYHHEDTNSFERKFREDRVKLIDAFEGLGNPFSDSENELVNIYSKQVLGDAAVQSIRNAESIGQRQSSEFVEERLVKREQSLYENIKRNNLLLFNPKATGKTLRAKKDLKLAKEDCRLFSSLYIACQTRAGDLDNFFAHENHSFPISLSEYGKLRKCSKSDFIECLTPISDPSYNPPNVDAMIIDGAGLVNMNRPESTCKTFGEYCEKQLVSKIQSLAANVDRLDIVFDVYRIPSLKQETREGRGVGGVRISVRRETPLPHKLFGKFLRVNENKTELFELIANTVVSQCNSPTIVCTRSSEVIANMPISTDFLSPCNHEEADTRLFVHVNDAVSNGHRKVMIIANDADVVVIALSIFHSIDVDELWIEYGTGTSRRWLPIHTYAMSLGEELCRALLFWFVFTGCDTVSSFCGRGKKTAWDIWGSYLEATETFIRFRNHFYLRILHPKFSPMICNIYLLSGIQFFKPFIQHC